MKQNIYIKQLGPIRECAMDVDAFTILTGAQASGKSTIAKAIYFFKTMKIDVFEQITHRITEDDYRSSMKQGLEKRVRNKFLRIFGSSWSMDSAMKMKYQYSDHMAIEVYLEPDHHVSYRNFVKMSFGEPLREFLEKYDESTYEWDQEEERNNLRDEIQKLFHDPYEAVYIPAGRSLTTVLSDYLASIMDDDQRVLDYCMRSYIRLILSKRPAFRNGIEGLFREKLQTTQDKINKETLKLLQKRMESVLCGRYIYDRGEEHLRLSDGSHRYVKINYASSGQQETVWVFNLLYYYLLERSKIFLIIEEPEAHLYPDAQKMIAEALGIFGNDGNAVFVTTHSPYMLGAFNNLCYASQLSDEDVGKTTMDKETFLRREDTSVWHLKDGKIQDGFMDEFINNTLIDGASDRINEEIDLLMDLVEEGERAHE